jgi:bifunctional non-homologous end joining protein LigD
MDDEFQKVILPQLSTLVTDAPDGDDWLHEIKYDGYRMLCRKDGERVDCFTRRGHRWSDKFPAISMSVAVWLRTGSGWTANWW